MRAAMSSGYPEMNFALQQGPIIECMSSYTYAMSITQSSQNKPNNQAVVMKTCEHQSCLQGWVPLSFST